MKYDEKSIIQLTEREHVRKTPGMYIGNTDNPTRLLDEVLDNALDEVQQSEVCDKIAIIIDTKEGYFSIIDTGRGIPFDQTLPLEKDPPVLACTSMRTSGKFRKNESDSAYIICSGLHGVGLTAVNFLSEKMIIEIYREKHSKYIFLYDGTIERMEEDYDKNKKPFSTKIIVYPSKKHFKNLELDIKHIEERLRIACSNYPNLKIAFLVNGEKKIISGKEEDLILDYLGKVNTWIVLKNNKDKESYVLKLGWDEEESSSTTRFLGVVNLIRVQDGSHVNKLYKMIKDTFQSFAQKYKFNFEPDDCLRWFRAYINLKIRDTSFEAQVKIKLGKDTDLSIMDGLDKQLENYFKTNEKYLLELLEKFQSYRNSIKGKKNLKKGNDKRVCTGFTKLRDCTSIGGELIIGEGESAIGGLIRVRDPKKHALLPLRGVIANALTKKDLLSNVEVKEILQAIGCGFDKDFTITKLRYQRIILAADADPAGAFITTLLIGLFMILTPELIKQGKIYICETPLFGYGEGDKFTPIWDEENLKKCRSEGKKIRRFKGLGEFDPEELKRFTLDTSTRKLICLEWGQNIENLKLLFTNSSEKRDLVLKQGKWK